MANKTIWKRKDLLGIEELTKEEIHLILNQTFSFKEILERPIKKVPTLRGKTIALIFFEASTRTRFSFELAAKRLSADTVSFAAASSSTVKGETLKDTAKNIEAMKVDLVILRHSMPGSSYMLSRYLEAGVVNAGDGSHEHPTQALLDVFSIYEKKKKIEGLKISIIGDVAHSRVARSNIFALKKLGAEVTICGPKTLIPVDIEKLGVNVTYNLDEAIKDADAINILRIQKERQKETYFPSIREYIKLYGITEERLKKAKKDVLIMHPGPINRGIELFQEVADGANSIILEQVTNGVAVRMAVLYLLCSGETIEEKEK